jgi:hypothetical protein
MSWHLVRLPWGTMAACTVCCCHQQAKTTLGLGPTTDWLNTVGLYMTFHFNGLKNFSHKYFNKIEFWHTGSIQSPLRISLIVECCSEVSCCLFLRGNETHKSTVLVKCRVWLCYSGWCIEQPMCLKELREFRRLVALIYMWKISVLQLE